MYNLNELDIVKKKFFCKYLLDELLMYFSDKYMLDEMIFNEYDILIN